MTKGKGRAEGSHDQDLEVRADSGESKHQQIQTQKCSKKAF